MHRLSIRAFVWDGLEGSFGIVELWVSLAGMLPIAIGMPESMGMVLEVDWNTFSYLLSFVRLLFVSNFLFNNIIQ